MRLAIHERMRLVISQAGHRIKPRALLKSQRSKKNPKKKGVPLRTSAPTPPSKKRKKRRTSPPSSPPLSNAATSCEEEVARRRKCFFVLDTPRKKKGRTFPPRRRKLQPAAAKRRQRQHARLRRAARPDTARADAREGSIVLRSDACRGDTLATARGKKIQKKNVKRRVLRRLFIGLSAVR
jgi:hypothetical protein